LKRIKERDERLSAIKNPKEMEKAKQDEALEEYNGKVEFDMGVFEKTVESLVQLKLPYIASRSKSKDDFLQKLHVDVKECMKMVAEDNPELDIAFKDAKESDADLEKKIHEKIEEQCMEVWADEEVRREHEEEQELMRIMEMEQLALLDEEELEDTTELMYMRKPEARKERLEDLEEDYEKRKQEILIDLASASQRMTAEKQKYIFEVGQEQLKTMQFFEGFPGVPSCISGAEETPTAKGPEEVNQFFYKRLVQIRPHIEHFNHKASLGQMFYKIRFANKKVKHVEVKIIFEPGSKGTKPQSIVVNTQKGPRTINFSEIKLVAKGFCTPATVRWSSEGDGTVISNDPNVGPFELEEDNVFSIVAARDIVDLYTEDTGVARNWVIGLRALIGQSEEKAEQLQQKLKKRPPIKPENPTPSTKKPKSAEEKAEQKFHKLFEAQMNKMKKKHKDKFSEEAAKEFEEELFELSNKEKIKEKKKAKWIREKMAARVKQGGKCIIS